MEHLPREHVVRDPGVGNGWCRPRPHPQCHLSASILPGPWSLPERSPLPRPLALPSLPSPHVLELRTRRCCLPQALTLPRALPRALPLTLPLPGLRGHSQVLRPAPRGTEDGSGQRSSSRRWRMRVPGAVRMRCNSVRNTSRDHQISKLASTRWKWRIRMTNDQPSLRCDPHATCSTVESLRGQCFLLPRILSVCNEKKLFLSFFRVTD